MSTFQDMVTFIKSAAPARRHIVVCMYGATGIGKSAACKQAAAELADEGLGTGRVVTIIASQILPNEVSGITMPVVESKAMEIFDHYRLSSLKDGDILFFDELLEADQLVLSACLTLIESREMMSGRKLPDVQIVAATNATVKPSMLKENIRQRFVWREFGIDYQGTHDYILDKTGMDLSDFVLNKIKPTGDEYNILTPRSLTKMCEWLDVASSIDEAKSIAEQINQVWRSALGSELLKAWVKAHNDPDRQMKDAVRKALDVTGNGAKFDVDTLFEDSTIEEVMAALQQLPEWNDIMLILADTQIEDVESEDIMF